MAIARASFGRTNHQSSRVIFGAAALSSVSQGVADRTLDVLLAHGINHIDVAASYGDAELRARLRALAHERRRFGYRRLHVFLKQEGFRVNHKRLFRLYREERLMVRRRDGRKRALGNSRADEHPTTPE